VRLNGSRKVGAAGYWEGALRDENDPLHAEFMRMLAERNRRVNDPRVLQPPGW
jgi:hypothetical protein